MNEGGSIEVWALDGMDLPEIGFMKIDVEGFEYDVLKGGERLLADMGPDIYIEIKDGDGKFDRVNGLLESFGYVMTERIYSDYLYRKQIPERCEEGRKA